ncbi:hypothetical protein L218DRAFT_828493, partial [Marasmius fiardii PR-910]
FYNWSLDPTGQSLLSLDMCKYLGLPFKLSITVEKYQRSWPTKIYQVLYSYQIARGFDPVSIDFAQ